eukprot:Nitzschia sp. Nitz4//scaffold4_size323378//247385//248365//NITZ4_000697-RA/size323378-processed-gene-0.221-mRNA-1//-1//CDS//3329553510//3267//frame0
MTKDQGRKRKGRPNNKKPIPLTQKPIVMKSRKRARQVTTQFHQWTHERERALLEGNQGKVDELDEKIEAMGGREEYQRASQLSTSYHSTSKWVLGYLTRLGWLYGVKEESIASEPSTSNSHQKQERRKTRVLEVGAINTELLEAAAASTGKGPERARHRLDVRAIDLNAIDERIEQADFLALPLVSEDLNLRYDVIVCSMVINCVPTPEDRGKMLARLYHHLRPGGILFLTLPKYCLTRSAFLTMEIFQQMLEGKDGVGFQVEETKQSPKVAFFICRRPLDETKSDKVNPKWTKTTIRNKGKKFPNQFAVVLKDEEVRGNTLQSPL